MEPEFSAQKSTLRDSFRVIFRQWFTIFVTIVVVVATVYIGLQMQTPVYTAQVKMLISGKREVQALYYKDLAQATPEVGLSQSEIVKSLPVLEQVVEALELYKRPLDYEKKFATKVRDMVIDRDLQKMQKNFKKFTPDVKEALLIRRAVEELRKNIEVQPIRDTNLFIIRVSDYDPIKAAILANVVSRAYVIFDLQQQVAEMELKYGEKHPVIQQLKDNIAMMQENLTGTPLRNSVEAMGPASVKIIEQAIPPLGPDKSNKSIIMIVAFFLSLSLALLLAYLFEFFDHTLRSPNDIEQVIKTRFLGSIPRKGLTGNVLLARGPSRGAYVRSIHNLGDQLRVNIRSGDVKTILVTSSQPKEGVSTVVSNLSYYWSHYAHLRVLLIDANVRKPELHTLFKTERIPGLMEVLEGKISFPAALRNISPNLDLLSAGESNFNATALLDSSRFNNLLKEAKQHYQVILIDSANLKLFKDALIIASFVDGVIFVVSEGRTRRYEMEHMITPFRISHVNMIGAILNKRMFSIPKFIYDRI